MKIIKGIVSKISQTVKDLLMSFPVTIISVVIVTLFLTITINTKFLETDDFQKIFIFGIIFSIESFFVESLLKKRFLKIVGIIVSAVVSSIFTIMLYNKNFSDIFIKNTTRILIGYLIILVLLAIYKILKNSEVKFNYYILKIFSNIFNMSIAYAVLDLGITLLSLIFVELILDGEYGSLLIRTQILLLGLFYIPAIINSITNIKQGEVNSFIKGLVKYVLLPIIAIGIFIIYVYIMKILVLRQMPSNLIFRILAGIFIVAFPVWNMAENFKDESKIIYRVSWILPYVYMPFILLEVYSVGIRIAEFGVTPARYFGIMFIILQIILLALTVIKQKKNLSKVFIYASVLTLIAFISPLNYENISIWNQKSILIKYIKNDTDFNGLSEEIKQKASGAYKYLKRNDCQKYIPEYIKDSNIATELNGYYTNKETLVSENRYESIFFNSELPSININRYSQLIKVNGYGKNNSDEIILKDRKNNYVTSINLLEIINNAIAINNKSCKEAIEYINNNQLVKIDDHKDLYIEELTITYNAQDNNIDSMSLRGYILEK